MSIRSVRNPWRKEEQLEEQARPDSVWSSERFRIMGDLFSPATYHETKGDEKVDHLG